MDNSIYKVTKVRDAIWRIQERSVYCFVVEGNEWSLLIDTGFGTGNIREVAESLTDKPLRLLNTHSDGDHIGCNGYFEKTMMHPAEFSRYWDKCKLEYDIEGYVCEPVPVWEGDVIDLGNYKFEVIHIPGHTMGSIALLEREKRFMFSGDTVQGHGHIHLWGNGRNAFAFLASMKKLKEYEGLVDVIYPSHDMTEVPPEFISQLAEAAEQVVYGKADGVTPDPSAYPFPIQAKLFAFPVDNLYYMPGEIVEGIIRKPEKKMTIR